MRGDPCCLGEGKKRGWVCPLGKATTVTLRGREDGNPRKRKGEGGKL